jgi:serine/threonine protein kinase
VLELCQLSLHQLFHGDDAQKKYREKMPQEEEVCLQLAKGLAHIHENRLIHRDLKPDNVLIWSDSRQENAVMKWADFGLSKQVNERGTFTMSGVKGTHKWFSPEIMKIFEEEENDGKTTTTTPDILPRGTVKSDVFTAGLVFGYYLLDGDHPFGSPINVLPNIFKNEPVNMPSKFRDLISQIEIANYTFGCFTIAEIKDPLMHAIIMEMLKDNPNERISSADVVTRINNLIKFQLRMGDRFNL